MFIVQAGVWISILIYLVGWSTRFSLIRERMRIGSTFGLRVLQLGCACHGLILVYELYTSNWPLTLVADLLNIIAWLPLFMYLLLRRHADNPISASVIPPFTIVLLMLSFVLLERNAPTFELIREAPLFYQTVLVTHVVSLIAGYVLFGLSCATSILFLYQEHQIKTKLVKILDNRFPALGTLDIISYRSIIIGFVFLTVGLVLGVLLTESLQSTRNVMRLGVTILIWLLYGVFLMERWFQGYQRRIAAIWSVVGFFLVLASLIIELVHLNAVEPS